MEERSSWMARDSCLSNISNKILEDNTKIQLLKCENQFLEQEIVKKIGENTEKKDLEHYRKLIIKLKQCDEIMQAFETKNLLLQSNLNLKEEELNQIHEENERLKFDKSRVLTENEEALRKMDLLLRKNEENEEKIKLLIEKLNFIDNDLQLSKAKVLDLEYSNEDLSKEKLKILEKLEQNMKKLKENDISPVHRKDEALIEKLKTFEDEIITITEENQDLLVRIDVNENEKTNLSDKVKSLEEDLTKISEENNDLQVKVDILENEKSLLFQELEAIKAKKDMNSPENQTLKAENEELKRKLNNFEIFSNSSEKTNEKDTILSTIQEKNSVLKLKTALSMKEKEFEKIAKQNKKFSTDRLSKTQENLDLKQEITNLKEKLNSAEIQIKKLENKNSQLQSRLSTKENELFQTIEKFQEDLNCKLNEIEILKEKQEIKSLNEKKKGLNFHKKRASIEKSLILPEDNNKSAVYFSCQNSFEYPPLIEEKKTNNFLKDMKKLDII